MPGDGKSISRKVASLNTLVHEAIILLWQAMMLKMVAFLWNPTVTYLNVMSLKYFISMHNFWYSQFIFGTCSRPVLEFLCILKKIGCRSRFLRQPFRNWVCKLRHGFLKNVSLGNLENKKILGKYFICVQARWPFSFVKINIWH